MKIQHSNRRIVILILLMVFSLVIPVNATQFISTGTYNFQEDEKLNDDLIITGESVKISGLITGDVIAACRSTVINGTIQSSVLCANQFNKVFGNIGGSLRVFCQDAQLNGKVKRNVLVFCGSFNFGPEGKVGQDINAYGGEIVIEGRVGNDLIIEGAEVIISGTIEGNAQITSDNITILPDAVIKGNLDYNSSRQAKIEDGATVLGITNWNKVEEIEDGKDKKTKWIKPITKVNFIVLLTSSIVHFIGLLAYAFIDGASVISVFAFTVAVYLALVVLVALTKERSAHTIKILQQSPIASLFLGLIAFIVIPIAAVVCMGILIGIPIGLLLIFIFGFLSIAGWLIGSLGIGDFIMKRFQSPEKRSPYLSGLVGIVLLVILAGVPVLGTILAFVTTFIGVGAILLAQYKDKKPKQY